MTTTVERTFEIDAPIEDVWAFISDPANRASAISFVDEYEVEGDEATWYVRIPIRLIRKRIAVKTRDTERREPEYVKFVGRSSVMRVVGEHELSATEDGAGCRVVVRFRVQEKLPGVERFFSANIDDEIRNLEAAIRDALETA